MKEYTLWGYMNDGMVIVVRLYFPLNGNHCFSCRWFQHHSTRLVFSILLCTHSNTPNGDKYVFPSYLWAFFNSNRPQGMATSQDTIFWPPNFSTPKMSVNDYRNPVTDKLFELVSDRTIDDWERRFELRDAWRISDVCVRNRARMKIQGHLCSEMKITR